MIKLSKQPKPKVLEDNAAAWTKALLEKIAAGELLTQAELSRYRHPEIKASLVIETCGKCAYCESKLLHVTYGDVEHIVPKSSSPEVTFCWDNLTLACDVCNTNKGNKFEAGVGLIDPYASDPAAHFIVTGAFIFARPGNESARLTELTLKLNRSELLERRGEKIRYLREQVEVVARAPEPLKKLLVENLKEEYSQNQEYAAVAKEFLSAIM